MEEVIDLKSVIRYFWKRKKIILYIVLSVFLFANIVNLISTISKYSIVSKINISSEANSSKISAYNDLLSSNIIIDKAIDNFGNDVNKSSIKKNLSISAENGSNIYVITLKYGNKEDGKRLCDLLVQEFINNVFAYDGSSASVYKNAVISNEINAIEIVKNEVFYVFVSFFIACIYVMIIYIFDGKIKSAGALNNCNVLGIINSKKNSEINLIKTKIKLNNLGNVILMSTPRDICFKNDVLDIAKVFSKDSKILFIDTNVRNKSKNIGYSDLLNNYNNNISKYISHKDTYDIMESGTCNSEVDILLSNKNNKRIITELRGKYDYLLLYNSNIVDYGDSLILSKLCDCNYILVGINQTDRKDFDKSINVYNQVNSDVNGIIIINKEREINLFGKISL